MNMKYIFSTLILLPSIALAGVNTKNGDFFISYADVTQNSAGHELNINRTYNSKSSYTGWFGYGWASIYETHLVVMPDGAVVVHEQGGGRENYYYPKDNSKFQAGVEKIVAAAVAQEKLDAEATADLRKKLLADEDARQKYVLKYGIKTELHDGEVAQADQCSFITRVKDEYRRTKCDSSNLFGDGTDYFDLNGRLIRNENEGYKFTIHYSGNQPDRIEDSLGQKLYLLWNASGQIKKVSTGTGAPILTYAYSEPGNLTMSNEIGGNEYKYEYDSNHNMTQIGYLDNTSKLMEYNDKSEITSVTEPNGSKTTYDYRDDPSNPSMHYWVTTTSIDQYGNKNSQVQEYKLGTDVAGVEKYAGLVTTQGDAKKDVIMDEQGRVKRVNNSDGSFSEFTYHPKFNKVSSVLNNDGKTDYKYNQDGSLIRVENSQGQIITLEYQAKKLISKIVEIKKSDKNAKRELKFKYNAAGKPIQIKLLGKGTINVQYDSKGEIADVSSKQGAAVALDVTDAFQTLLEVVKVGGVEMGL